MHLEERQGGFSNHPLRPSPRCGGARSVSDPRPRAADFLWCENAKPNDGAASDYFHDRPSRWKATKRPVWYRQIRNEIGYGVLHVSYKRQALTRWTWKHREITHKVVRRLDIFVKRVPPQRLDADWRERYGEYRNPPPPMS